MRHSVAANNGVASLFSNNLTAFLLAAVDAWVLKRLTLDNKADTEMEEKRMHLDIRLCCYVTLVFDKHIAIN